MKQYMGKDRIAILAGDGDLPVILANNLEAKNEIALLIVLQGDRDRFDNIRTNVFEIAPGRVMDIINLISGNRINKVIMLGKIDKEGFIQRKGFDEKTLKIIKAMNDGKDFTIFHFILDELKRIGVEILPQDLYLEDMTVNSGILTRRKPEQIEMEDALFGMDHAKRLATMDIGQTIVVKNKIVLAVEAVEGTNETIKRGGRLGQVDSVVCKAARENQDRRFDIPVVGMETIMIMKEYGCNTLALESGKILIVNMDEIIDYAGKTKISIIGI